MIYICIPTWNEQQTVGVVLWKLRQVLTDFPRDYQLLVADDASSDKTPDVLEPYTRVLPLTVIRSEQRLGYAASLEMLLREAVRRSEYPKRDVIVALQADFSDEPDDLVPLIKRLEAGADIAVGNKVGSHQDPRARRWSRTLARFFTRKQKWPEGVVSPFDGYRAYRLYAVKRAIEDRPGRRLIRYDGWAGHAELLKAVLPHARRVDVVDVDDRPDRLQRARREKPWAAAMQVRAMAGNVEPAGLTGVEELDRTAATASRSRERAAVTVQSISNGRGARGNGRSRDRRPGGEPRREQSGRGRQERQDRQPRGEGRGQRSDRPAAQQQRPRREPGQQTERPRRESRPRRPDAEAAPPAEETVLTGAPDPTGLEGAVAPAEATGEPKKRKRRRRRKPGARSAEAGQVEGSAPGEAAESDGSDEGPAGEAGEAGEPAGAGEGGAPKKRRRRGGRRGGRGRRRSVEAAAESGAGAGAEVAPEARVDHAPSDGAGHVETD